MDRRNSMLALLAGSYLAAGGPVQAAQSGLRIGLTPVILADQVAFLSRWGRYLSSTVGCPIEFVARESYQLILEMLFSEQIDAAWICGYPFVRYESSLSLLAVPMYAGQPSYQAYLIRPRKADGLVKGWADLRGKVLAYSDPLSNSGWLVAQAEMAKAGESSRTQTHIFRARASQCGRSCRSATRRCGLYRGLRLGHHAQTRNECGVTNRDRVAIRTLWLPSPG